MIEGFGSLLKANDSFTAFLGFYIANFLSFRRNTVVICKATTITKLRLFKAVHEVFLAIISIYKLKTGKSYQYTHL